jgi:hypothetical protein
MRHGGPIGWRPSSSRIAPTGPVLSPLPPPIVIVPTPLAPALATVSNERGRSISRKDQGVLLVEPAGSAERRRRNGWWDGSANGRAIAMDGSSSYAQEPPLSSSSIFGVEQNISVSVCV